jgi:hypothetical protein
VLPDCNNSIKTSRFLKDGPSLPMDYYQRRSLPAGSVTRLQHQAILSTGTGYTSRRSPEMVPTMVVRPDEESRSGGLADFKKVFPPHLIRNGSRSDAKGIIVGVHDRQS